jgi:hypothetical protein
MEHQAGYNRPDVPSVRFFFESAPGQIQARPVMNGLPAGPLNDAAGLDAVRADLASVVQQVPGPARVSLRISPPRPGQAEPGPPLARAITD